jgi:hypothetical protein
LPFYGNAVITPGECPQFLNETGYNANQGYFKGQNGVVTVCERATVRFHAQNISFNCGPSPQSSFCDLLFYAGTQLSLYVDNRNIVNEFTVGEGYSIGGCV